MTDKINGEAPANDPQTAEATAREDKAWAIRGMDPLARDGAVAAAKRQRLTVSEWLAIAIRRELAHEHQSGLSGHPLEGELYGPGAQLPALRDAAAADTSPWQTFTLEQWEQVRALIKRSGELRPDGQPDPKLVAKFEKRLRDLLFRCAAPGGVVSAAAISVVQNL